MRKIMRIFIISEVGLLLSLVVILSLGLRKFNNFFSYYEEKLTLVDKDIRRESRGFESLNEDDLISALIEVESSGHPSAYNINSGATGCLQITDIMVDEVNRILNLTNINKHYTPGDRWDCDKSIEMFLVWKNYHHSNSSWETISRHWWGGPIYGESDISLPYWESVQKYLNIILQQYNGL